VIDPIYKVITGDENSADQMANFCNQFDKVCTELGCAVIYCHHHSKGTQGQKRSMDRASGSGVFARDPDAMLDMIELDVTDALRKAEGDRAVCRAYEAAFDRVCGAKWRDEASQDDLCSAAAMRDLAAKLLTRAQELAIAQELADARTHAEKRTAWRIEGTLREFAPFHPLSLWFDYPVHRGDANGALGDLYADGEQPPWQKATAKHKKVSAQKKNAYKVEFDTVMQNCRTGDVTTFKDLQDYYGGEKSDDTLYRWIKKYGYQIDKNTGTVIKTEQKEEPQ